MFSYTLLYGEAYHFNGIQHRNKLTKTKMMNSIEQLFGGKDAEEQNVLLHIIKQRGYSFFEETPKTTMTCYLIEDLHKLGYKIVNQNKEDE